jgi:D-lyxose ketol-isomerase
LLTQDQVNQYRVETAKIFKDAGIFVTDRESKKLEIADFGLNNFMDFGLGVLVYLNTNRCCAKEIAMWPRQICPEHIHPSVGSDPGKEETFRCRSGTVYLYVTGEKSKIINAKFSQSIDMSNLTVWHEIVLHKGEQYTLAPETWHWFQAGDEGAVVSEFSTHSTDENDIFRDPVVQRATKII